MPKSGENEGGDTEDSRKLMRKVGADSIVLLKNDRKVLPLETSKKQRYGLIRELFRNPAVCGGGSSEAALSTSARRSTL